VRDGYIKAAIQRIADERGTAIPEDSDEYWEIESAILVRLKNKQHERT
jgi:hypothetical protein